MKPKTIARKVAAANAKGKGKLAKKLQAKLAKATADPFRKERKKALRLCRKGKAAGVAYEPNGKPVVVKKAK